MLNNAKSIPNEKFGVLFLLFCRVYLNTYPKPNPQIEPNSKEKLNRKIFEI